MSEGLSEQDRLAARMELDRLEVSIEQMADLGVDVDKLGLRATAEMIRREIEKGSRRYTLEMWLRSMPENQVITYRVRFPSNTTVYSFTAIKFDQVWFTSARTGSRQFSSANLAKWMAENVVLVGCVRMRVAGAKDPHRSPDVVMG